LMTYQIKKRKQVLKSKEYMFINPDLSAYVTFSKKKNHIDGNFYIFILRRPQNFQ
jgi:hypothetical protein